MPTGWTKAELEAEIAELEENRELQDRLDAVADIVNDEEEDEDDEIGDDDEERTTARTDYSPAVRAAMAQGS